MKSILCDMDGILVDLFSRWYKEYTNLTGESLELSDVVEYNLEKLVSQPDILIRILQEPGFYADLPSMPSALTYMSKLIEEGYDVVILTQAPRSCDWAVKDKREWVRTFLPTLDVTNMIFAHRKELVRGALLFDDKPSHLTNWKENNPEGLTVTIDYPYNRDVVVDKRLERDENAWEEFYRFVKKNV